MALVQTRLRPWFVWPRGRPLCICGTTFKRTRLPQRHSHVRPPMSDLHDLHLCPQKLLTDACADVACTRLHDFAICSPCGVVAIPALGLGSHMQSATHGRRAINRSSTIFRCSLCEISVQSLPGWQSHVSGRPHVRKANQEALSPHVTPEVDLGRQGYVYCTNCDIHVPKRDWQNHESNKAHLRRSRLRSFMAAFERTQDDQGGLKLSHRDGGVDFGVINPGEIGQGRPQIKISARATSSSSSRSLQIVEMRIVKALTALPTNW
jgi:helicase MOV-10